MVTDHTHKSNQPMETNISCSIVIPVYNSSSVLFELTERIQAVFLALDKTFEIIFVDDGSFEKQTRKCLEDIEKKYDFVKAFKFARNFGQHVALFAGMKESRGEHVITMDDDLQHRPEDIPFLLEKKDHDVVIAKFVHKKHSLLKRLGSQIKGYCDSFFYQKPISTSFSSFILYHRRIVDQIVTIRCRKPIFSSLIFSLTDDVINVSLPHQARKQGKSGYSVAKMVELFFSYISHNSKAIFSLLGIVGIFVTFISLFGIIMLFFIKMLFDFSGLILFSILFGCLFWGVLQCLLALIGVKLSQVQWLYQNNPMYYLEKKSTTRTNCK